MGAAAGGARAGRAGPGGMAANAAKLLLLAPFAAAAPLFTCRHPTGLLTFTLDASTGSYAIHLRSVGLDGSPASPVTVHSAPYRVLHGGGWLNSTAGEGLVLQPPTEIHSGQDQHGAWYAVALRWKVMKQQHVLATSPSSSSSPPSPSPPVWVTSFRCYNRTGTVVFTQSFPDGLHDVASSTKGRSVNRPSTAFPAFGATVVSSQDTHAQQLGIVTFEGQNAAPTTKVGMWPGAYRGGYDGGPLALFVPHDLAQGIALLSPLTQFLDTVHAQLFSDDALSFGIGGMIKDVPAGFAVDFVVSFSYPPAPSGDGYAGLMARAWMTWGDFLLEHYQQQRSRPAASPWVSQLGYSTTGVFHCKPRPTLLCRVRQVQEVRYVPRRQPVRLQRQHQPFILH